MTTKIKQKIQDPQALVQTSFLHATPDCYWHYLVAHKTKAKNYKNMQLIAELGKKISTATGKPNSFGTRSVHGWTPLHVAALKGNKEGIAFLLSRGVPTNEKADDGCTALEYCQTYHPDLLPLLQGSQAIQTSVETSTNPMATNTALANFLET